MRSEGGKHTKNSRIDLRDTFVPDLAPHVGTSASASVQTMLSREFTNIEMEAIAQRWDGDRLGWRWLGKKQQNVSVVGSPALGMRWDVRGMSLRDFDGSCSAGQGDIGSVQLSQWSGECRCKKN